ncbi:RidA family protein [Paenibacillus tarimensis]|uniref:RidA family protein n=1 Tax=Paenibacillus tarimensis TaxID=416012 RepID=UPI001F36F220|nr:RidA family protein [Paenibacillus tarimensis]MCF2945159.1 RidA family protein [Paenibacillus tarimensis]
MSEKKYFSTSPYEKELGFSRALRRGLHFFVAGTASIGTDGKTVCSDDTVGQARHCMRIIEDALKGIGASVRDVTRTRILLTSIGDWNDVLEIHREYFESIRPVCTVMEVSGFIRPEWKVEIEVEGIIQPEKGSFG